MPKKLNNDTKFSAYIDLYGRLDQLVWANLAILVTVTTLCLAGIGTIVEKGIEFGPLNVSQTTAAILFLTSLISWVVIYSSWRMKMSQRALERELSAIEQTGYFRRRSAEKWSIQRIASVPKSFLTVPWWISAAVWVNILFLLLSFGAIFSAKNLWNGEWGVSIRRPASEAPPKTATDTLLNQTDSKTEKASKH